MIFRDKFSYAILALFPEYYRARIFIHLNQQTVKNLNQEIILLGPQDNNPWLIESLSKGLIILDILEQCKSEVQIHAMQQLLMISANASLDIMSDIYSILYKSASLTMRSKYNALDEIESTFKIPNVRLEFNVIIDKYKLRKK